MKGLRIAFGYKARVGKNVAVSYLKRKYGGKEYAISKPLYSILHYAQKKCNFPKCKDRDFLQYIGTDWARKIDNDVWIDICIKKINKLPKDTNIYISDLRFPNEFKKLKKQGFIMVRIDRELALYDNTFGSGTRSHISENSLNDGYKWDHIINNNNTITDFYNRIDRFLDL